MLRSLFSLIVTSVPCELCGASAFYFCLCRNCRRRLDEEAVYALSEKHRCIQCGRPLLSEHEICTACRENSRFIETDGVFPLFTYVLSKKKLLYSWKIARQRSLTGIFARYLADVLISRYPDAVVVPVPPRPGKIKKNGWDQIEDIALYLEFVHHIHVERLLRRTEARQQKKLTREERNEHSKHAYIIDEKALRKYKGKLQGDFILLDDVITTGSTINACARILKNAGKVAVPETECEVERMRVFAVSLFIVPG